MKLFTGGMFGKKGILNDEVAADDTPAFIEISSVRSGAYKAPSSPGFENETTASEESDP